MCANGRRAALRHFRRAGWPHMPPCMPKRLARRYEGRTVPRDDPSIAATSERLARMYVRHGAASLGTARCARACRAGRSSMSSRDTTRRGNAWDSRATVPGPDDHPGAVDYGVVASVTCRAASRAQRWAKPRCPLQQVCGACGATVTSGPFSHATRLHVDAKKGRLERPWKLREGRLKHLKMGSMTISP